ncbi:MAG TPA: signal recognition particle-docking protein FtsY [Chloroflexota bacterium]|nr:signal recognition particle-docking protein FtsY [Chloroflexota bacterium]
MVFNLFRRPRPQPTREAAQPDAQPDAQPEAPLEPAREIEQSLEKTRGGMFGAVRSLFQQRRELDASFWDELEETLLQADVGAHTTADLVDELRARHARRRFSTPEEAEEALQEVMVGLLGTERPSLNLPEPLGVILVVGVNGVGKTTSIAKLAHFLADAGRKPLLVAGDTFRAAAIDQLKIWGERTRTPVVAQVPGADPGAVAYDGIQAARSRGLDVVIIDTAGRLHTKTNLMDELSKVRRIVERQLPGAPHETLLVLDAVTGQNGLTQAKTFAQAVGVTGLILAKLDSSAKGGVVFSIAQELKLPIKFAGTGEQLGDFTPFDPQAFAAALFK